MVPVKWDRPHIEAMVRRFEAAHPEIRVKLMWVPATQYQTKFKTLAAAGRRPTWWSAATCGSPTCCPSCRT
jgi:ABC-type glycerol-3-phosphate transport system substrate-binding protein